MTQLAKWLIPKPEVYGLNPVIDKIYIKCLFSVNCIEKAHLTKMCGEIVYDDTMICGTFRCFI